jgi:hypothetical protein
MPTYSKRMGTNLGVITTRNSELLKHSSLHIYFLKYPERKITIPKEHKPITENFHLFFSYIALS